MASADKDLLANVVRRDKSKASKLSKEEVKLRRHSVAEKPDKSKRGSVVVR